MNKSIDKFAHLVLYGVIALGFVAIYLARFDAVRQFIVILLMVGFYLIWGFVFHHYRGDATKKLMIEYLLIAAVSLLASFFVFLL